MVVVCLVGLVSIWVLPRSVWAVILPSALLAEPGPAVIQPSQAVAAVPTSTLRAVAQTLAMTPSQPVFISPLATLTSIEPPPAADPSSTPTGAPALTQEPVATQSPAESPPQMALSAVAETPVPTAALTATPTEISPEGALPEATETPVPTATPTETPTEMPVVAVTPTQAPPTATPIPTATLISTMTWTPVPTQIAPPTENPVPTAALQTMFVCGYERCRDQAEYGQLIFESEIEVWASSDPNDDQILYTLSHHDEVRVVNQVRVWDGPGGLWFELEEGGWMSDFWLTEERCTPENLQEYSFVDCLLGVYE